MPDWASAARRTSAPHARARGQPCCASSSLTTRWASGRLRPPGWRLTRTSRSSALCAAPKRRSRRWPPRGPTSWSSIGCCPSPSTPRRCSPTSASTCPRPASCSISGMPDEELAGVARSTGAEGHVSKAANAGSAGRCGAAASATRCARRDALGARRRDRGGRSARRRREDAVASSGSSGAKDVGRGVAAERLGAADATAVDRRPQTTGHDRDAAAAARSTGPERHGCSRSRVRRQAC